MPVASKLADEKAVSSEISSDVCDETPTFFSSFYSRWMVDKNARNGARHECG